MRQFLIVSLFVVLLGDLMLGLGFGLAPGLSLKNALLYVLFVALVLDVTIGGRDLYPEAWRFIGVWIALIVYAMSTWLAVSLLGIHRGYGFLDSFIAFKNQLVDFFLFFLLFMYGPRTMSQALVLARWLVVIITFTNLITLIDVFDIPDLGIMEDRPDSRIAGPIGSVNQYGAVLAFVVPLSIGVAVASQGRARYFHIVGALIGIVLLGLTISRGAFVGLIAGTGTMLIAARAYYTKRALRRGVLYSILALALVTAAIAMHDPDAFKERFDFTEVRSVQDISSGRTDTWRRALTMMSYEPISFVTGYGWDSYRVLFLGYGDPHNEYLLFFFNLGLFGLTLFLYVLFWVYRCILNGLRHAGDETRPLLIGFLTGWISVLVAVFFVGLYLPWLFIWACTGTFIRLAIELQRSGVEVDARNRSSAKRPDTSVLASSAVRGQT